MTEHYLTRPLSEVGIGEHLCLVFESDAERLAAVIPFLQQGLARNECCLCLVDADTAAPLSAALSAAGVDVPREQQRGALAFVTERDYLRDGRFEPQSLLDTLQRTLAEALEAGFSGWRATGDMVWELGPISPYERLLEYESALDEVFPGRRMIGLCQYDRRRVPPAVLRQALRTHRHVVLDGTICSNPYYVPPALARNDDGEAARVAWMLAQIARLCDAEALREQAIRDQAARAAAEMAIRMRNDFLASVSHDLQNPLGLIRNQAQLMSRRLDRGDHPDSERFRAGLARVEAATRRASDLIGELLDVARLEAGQTLVLERQSVDLIALAQRAVSLTAPTASHKTITLNAAEPSLVGQWDGARLERVVANLLSNAVKYGAVDDAIEVDLAREGGDAVLTVRDHGLGIPKEDLPHVFERFHRGHNVTAQVPGTGLGLAGARTIVEQLGGTIEIFSVEGEGTAVTVRLPLAATSGDGVDIADTETAATVCIG